MKFSAEVHMFNLERMVVVLHIFERISLQFKCNRLVAEVVITCSSENFRPTSLK